MPTDCLRLYVQATSDYSDDIKFMRKHLINFYSLEYFVVDVVGVVNKKISTKPKKEINFPQFLKHTHTQDRRRRKKRKYLDRPKSVVAFWHFCRSAAFSSGIIINPIICGNKTAESFYFGLLMRNFLLYMENVFSFGKFSQLQQLTYRCFRPK
jgi:hypothetical protein